MVGISKQTCPNPDFNPLGRFTSHFPGMPKGESAKSQATWIDAVTQAAKRSMAIADDALTAVNINIILQSAVVITGLAVVYLIIKTSKQQDQIGLRDRTINELMRNYRRTLEELELSQLGIAVLNQFNAAEVQRFNEAIGEKDAKIRELSNKLNGLNEM